jgi:hypothetical protein
VAVIAAGGVDDVAAEPDQRAILAREIERHRIDFETALDLALAEIIAGGGSGNGQDH